MPIVYGSDFSRRPVSARWVGDAAWELQSLVMAGIPPAEAIIDASRASAAHALKLNHLGTVAAGKSADFIVLDANPLDDICLRSQYHTK